MSFDESVNMGAAVPAEVAVKVSGLGKCYQLFDRPSHRLMQSLVGGGRKYYREFWALRNIDFEVRRGETMGIVGRNGSGKSTLLQMIAGTLTPTEGKVEVRGRVAALLELGSGFNPDFTGRENVYLNAAILGLSRAEVDGRIHEILEFADIGEFIDQPVRNYSSGMVMRLAFSVMTHVDADILIIDEALAVGDAFFNQKCMRYLRAFKDRGTLLFVSHDGSAVTGLCDHALWIDEGATRATGNAKDVMTAYIEAFFTAQALGKITRAGDAPHRAGGERRVDHRQELMDRSTLRNDIQVLPFEPDDVGFGEFKARIIDVAMVKDDGTAVSWIIGGEQVTLEITGIADEAIESVIVGFYVKDRLGQLLFGDNTYLDYHDNAFAVVPGETFRAKFSFEMPRLSPGDYFITAGMAEGTQQDHMIQHWMHEALAFKSRTGSLPGGILGLPMLGITLERAKNDE